MYTVCMLLLALSAAAAATPAHEAVRHLPVAPESIATVLPLALDRFFVDFYDRTMLRINHSEAQRPPLWTRADLERDLASIAADGKLGSGGVIAKHGPGKGALPAIEPNATAVEAEQWIEGGLRANVSFVLKYEYVSPAHRPLKWVNDALFNLTGIPASLHLYVSAAGAQVLNPHTDPYDVLVHQLVGTKRWRACVPRAEIAAASYSAGTNLTYAQRCLLQELAKDNIQGCTQYSVTDTHSLQCDDFTMSPGDFLYMPKGVVHYALTDPSSDSYHLTIGLHRDNMQWRDVVRDLLDADDEGPPSSRALHAELMDIYSESGEGVHLQEAVPGWLLKCRRPWELRGDVPRRLLAEEPPQAAVDGDADCGALDAELVRLFELHLGRFGAWLYPLAQEGPWKLALAVAQREKRAGEEPDLEGVAPLFWWSGDLSFLSRLRSDRARLLRALNHVAKISDYHDTTATRWKPRTKGGQREVRSMGEPPRGGPTLCDELTGWQTECRGSDAEACEVFVGHKTKCSAFCESNDAWCVAAWDDAGGGCQRGNQGHSASCHVTRTNQICRCQRACVDGGPWECTEEGCPARSVTCNILGVACNARFSDIWRKPPQGLGDLQVKQVCPMACNRCVSNKPADESAEAAAPSFLTARPV